MKTITRDILPLSPNRVWRSYTGGKCLDAIEGRAAPCDGNFPEDWIGSLTVAKNPGSRDPNEGLAKINHADHKQSSLLDTIREDPEFFLGKSHFKRFGLDLRILVKYLDSAIRLHFQVHPTAQFSRKFLSSDLGKTEAYVILDTRNDIDEPYIYAGFQRPPSREQLKAWIEKQDLAAIESCFDKIPVKKGDVFLIPGGCPHALGEGILMVELMEASDWVVRFEYERGGYILPEESRYMGRDLDFALGVFDLEPKCTSDFRCRPRKLRSWANGSEELSLIGSEQTKCFAARSLRIEKAVTKEVSEFYIMVVTEGSGRVTTSNQTLELNPYDRVFVAAGAGSITIETKDGMQLLELAGPKV